jgi:hypothetical protein
VPLSTALLVGAATQRWVTPRPWMTGASLAVLVLLAGAGIYYTAHDFEQKQDAPDRAMLDWVSQNSRPEDTYLIPIKMENFRLETLRPVYIDFMSIPYAGPDVMKRYARLIATGRFYRERTCSQVVDFANDGGVTHIVSKQDQPFNCHFLIPVYQDDEYIVYWIDRSIW